MQSWVPQYRWEIACNVCSPDVLAKPALGNQSLRLCVTLATSACVTNFSSCDTGISQDTMFLVQLKSPVRIMFAGTTSPGEPCRSSTIWISLAQICTILHFLWRTTVWSCCSIKTVVSFQLLAFTGNSCHLMVWPIPGPLETAVDSGSWSSRESHLRPKPTRGTSFHSC